MANPIAAVIVALVAAPGILNGLQNTFPPYAALQARRGYKDRPVLIPTADELVGLRLREDLTDEKYHALMREVGFDEPIAQKLLRGARQYMTALDYITLWRRGDITEDDADNNLRQLGFDDQQTAMVKQVTLYYPTPQDIVRFAVRDVYTPETVKTYGLDKDIPPDYIPAGLKAGLAETTARQYWAAHWELPSPTQVFEMLHRRVITEDQVEDFLRTADYMPYWREKLTKISYHPLTRVDVQRMYRMGVLGTEQVYDSYRDLGYTDANAKLMTDFTVAMSQGKDEETPKSTILASYDAGLIDRPEATKQLQALKLTDEAIGMTLDLADDQIRQERIDLEADAIIDHYNQGGIDLNEVRVQLAFIGVPVRMMELVIQRELAQARKRAKVATKSDLDRWMLYGFLSTDQYTKRMRQLGYSQSDVDMYLDEAMVELMLGAAKKYPFATVLHEYSERRIPIDEVGIRLKALGYGQQDIDGFMDVARHIQSQNL